MVTLVDTAGSDFSINFGAHNSSYKEGVVEISVIHRHLQESVECLPFSPKVSISRLLFHQDPSPGFWLLLYSLSHYFTCPKTWLLDISSALLMIFSVQLVKLYVLPKAPGRQFRCTRADRLVIKGESLFPSSVGDLLTDTNGSCHWTKPEAAVRENKSRTTFREDNLEFLFFLLLFSNNTEYI